MKHRGTVGRHGLRYRFNFLAGTPYFKYDDEGERYIAGWYVAEPKWAEADLTPKQLAEINAEIARHPDNGKHNDLELRHLILEWDGIEHTHRQGKPILDYRPAYGYECSMCKAYIIAKNPGDAPFYGGPLNGRWVVTGGRDIWRVPLPVVLSLSMDDPMPSAAFPMAEYRRGRDGAYYIDRQTLP